jgi:hypothetical protein
MAMGLDVQGTWMGKYSCKVFNGTKSTEKVETSTLKITAGVLGLAVDIDGRKYYGNTIDDAEDDTKGEMGITDCDTATDEVGRFTVRGDKLKGLTLQRIDNRVMMNAPENASCKMKYTRTDTVDPGAMPCP